MQIAKAEKVSMFPLLFPFVILDYARKFGTWLIVLYLVLEYVRPQSFIPGLEALHIPMFVQLAIILALSKTDLKKLKSKESLIFFLLICLMVFHIPFANNNYWAYWTTRNMILQFVVFLGIIGFLRSYKRFNTVITLWILIAVVCGLKGYFEGGRISNSAFLGDENDFSLFLNMMVPLAFFKGYSASTKKMKYFFYAVVLVLILGSVSSFSRGGFLGLLPPLFYCWWKTPKKIKSAAVSIFIGIILAVFVISDSYWKEMKTIQAKGASEGTGEYRMYLWKCGWRMFLDNVLIGAGPGNFPWNLDEYEPVDGRHGRSERGRVAHSIYLTLLPELGLAGLFMFVGFVLVNQADTSNLRKRRKAIYPSHALDKSDAWEKVKKLEAMGMGFTGAIIAYLISGAFLSVLYYGHFWLIIGFSVAGNNLMKELLEEMEEKIEGSSADVIDENCSDRWQYSSGARDYPLSR